MRSGSGRLGLGMAAVRTLAALAMVGGLGVASTRVSAAQVEGDTFTAESYDWSITWDDRVWEVDEALQDDGYDAVTLSSDAGVAYIEGYAGFDGDPDACLEDAVEQLEARDGITDLTEADDLDVPRMPRGAEGVVYTFSTETDEGDVLEIAEYTECRTLVENEAVFELTFQTLLEDYEDELPAFEELLAGLEVNEAGTTDGTDEEETAEADETEEAEDGRDTTLDDDEEEEDEDTDAPADSGVDGNQYESPTYGYTVEWDEDIWEADAADELVDYTDDFFEGLDRLVLSSVEQFGTLYIEGKVAYEGDAELCLEEEADLLADEPGVEEFELLEDENGDPLTGETDDGNFFGVYAVVYVDPDDEDAEPFELIDYVECRELVEGEAVLVITFVTGLPDEFADNFELVQEVINTIELGTAAGGDEETEEAEEDETAEADEEETEEAQEEETEEAGTVGGVDGNTYESPSYGYGLEWDDAVWTLEDETSGGGTDTLTLSSEFGVVAFVASDEFAGDPADCYDALETQTGGDFPDLTLLEGEDGSPFRSSDPTGEFGAYGATVNGQPSLVILECRPIVEDESTVAISFISSAPSVDDALDAYSTLLDSFQAPRG